MIKAAGVMGFPISHSLSPRLHGYWINKYDLEASYVAWEVRPEDLEKKLKELPEECLKLGEQFRGTNLTIPHKELAMDIVDEIEISAQEIGAVNTVVVGDGGQLIGRNTDGVGFADSLAEYVDISAFDRGEALVIGAGGASKAIVHALNKMGFDRIAISNRTKERAIDLKAETGLDKLDILDWDHRDQDLDQIDLVVNTTSLGMKGQPALEFTVEGLKETAVVTDIVYTPLETDLLKNARLAGYKTVDGLGMLLHQAKAGFEAWFGKKPEVDQELRDFVLQGLKT